MSIRRSFIAVLSLTLIASFAAVQAQDTQYAQGLLLDYYVIETPDDVKGPVGRSMATLVDKSAPEMSYLGPFEIEPALEQFRDKLWGLHWTGFLKINVEGEYSLNLLLNTSSQDKDSYYSHHAIGCQSWLKIQDRVIASHERQPFWDGNQNSYGDIDLQSGIYNFEVWFACNEVGDRTSINKAKPSITVNMRGPNDAMLTPIPKNQLLHEP